MPRLFLRFAGHVFRLLGFGVNSGSRRAAERHSLERGVARAVRARARSGRARRRDRRRRGIGGPAAASERRARRALAHARRASGAGGTRAARARSRPRRRRARPPRERGERRSRGCELEHDARAAARRRESRASAPSRSAKGASARVALRAPRRERGDAIARRSRRGSAASRARPPGAPSARRRRPGARGEPLARRRAPRGARLAELDGEEGAQHVARATSSLRLHAAEPRQIERRAEQRAPHPVERDLRGEAAVALAVEGETQLAHLRCPRRSRARRRPGRRASPPCRPSGPAMPVVATARSAPKRARAPSAIARATGSDTAPCSREHALGHAEQRRLGVVRVGDDAALEVRRRARHVA